MGCDITINKLIFHESLGFIQFIVSAPISGKSNPNFERREFEINLFTMPRPFINLGMSKIPLQLSPRI